MCGSTRTNEISSRWIIYDGAELKIIYIRHIFGTVQKFSLGVEDF